MPDFDTNDDPLRLSATGEDDPFELPKLTPRFSPRARQLAERRCYGPHGRPWRRVGPVFMARGRFAARNPCAERMALLGTPPRRRRRLWTQCHGRASGSVS